MASLKNRIRLLEYEIGNDRALIANEYRLLKTELATPKSLAMGFLGGLAIGFMVTHKTAGNIKRKALRTLPALVNQFTPGINYLLPLIFK